VFPNETLSEEFAGLELTVSGLVHLKGLVNDPTFGRMISADPTVRISSMRRSGTAAYMSASRRAVEKVGLQYHSSASATCSPVGKGGAIIGVIAPTPE
jgi:hypothetical protein